MPCLLPLFFRSKKETRLGSKMGKMVAVGSVAMAAVEDVFQKLFYFYLQSHPGDRRPGRGHRLPASSQPQHRVWCPQGGQISAKCVPSQWPRGIRSKTSAGQQVASLWTARLSWISFYPTLLLPRLPVALHKALPLSQRSPAYLAPGTGFMEDKFSTDPGGEVWFGDDSTSEKVKVLVTQSCPTLCDPMGYSPRGSSVHGFLQARILEYSLLQGIIPTQGSKPGLLHCRRILYHWATRVRYIYCAHYFNYYYISSPLALRSSHVRSQRLRTPA